MSLGVVSNFYREKFALPGFLENASKFFDEIVMISAPPAESEDEECCQMVRDFGARLVQTTVNGGFGKLRSQCIQESKCDFLMIMDCDERFYPTAPVLQCHGHEKYPEVQSPNLRVDVLAPSSSVGERLKILAGTASPDVMAIRMSRRHWFDAPGSMERPCQNWNDHPDWQLRCVRNSQFVCFDPSVKLHERLIYTPTCGEPKWICAGIDGPTFSHHNHWAKLQEPEQMAEDLKIYEALDYKGTENMWVKTGFKEGGK